MLKKMAPLTWLTISMTSTSKLLGKHAVVTIVQDLAREPGQQRLQHRKEIKLDSRGHGWHYVRQENE